MSPKKARTPTKGGGDANECDEEQERCDEEKTEEKEVNAWSRDGCLDLI